ncbi:esterase [Trichodelitschia bisporula]|uniref:Esterase n=1 Tax=Trichodelitschia bisporula TaxID=703511 RepID=A0A6G1HPW6_9PEZI|nr:esterase [Trichodelitschia bisporula]
MVVAAPAQAGILHRYAPRLVAFEHRPSSIPASAHTGNVLIFIGGLSDGLLTVSYPSFIAARAPPGWSIVEALISAAYSGWGTSTLQRDVAEIAKCVAYLRALPSNSTTPRRIVLMGHSTGAQDAIEYVVGAGAAERPPVDGVILQAGISDREAMHAKSGPSKSDEAMTNAARGLEEQGRAEEFLPRAVSGSTFTRTAVTAYRWLSLTQKGGDDDYFSSDIADEELWKTFGKFGKTQLMVLLSGIDEHMPKWVDKEALAARWARICKEGGAIVDEEFGGVVPGAHHNLEQDGTEVVDDLCRRVTGFLGKVGGDSEPHL